MSAFPPTSSLQVCGLQSNTAREGVDGWTVPSGYADAAVFAAVVSVASAGAKNRSWHL